MTIRDRWDHRLLRLQQRYGIKRIAMLGVLVVAGLASVVIQLLTHSRLGHSAVLYLAVPYGVAVLITLLRPYREPDTWWKEYLSHSASALVVFLASAVVLLEGFVCVLFFMPIYFFVVTIAFIGHWLCIAFDRGKGRTYGHALPIVIAIFSLEGTFDVMTIDRHNTATATLATTATPEAVLANLASPIEVPTSSDWMLGVFPMPVEIEAGSLKAGDVHRVHTRYHRWFFTNTHEGEIAIQIDTVTPDRVTATFVQDTSYFSNYVRLIGSDIRVHVADDGLTHISLSIHYERRLDPAWYFQPVQQYAMRTMATHLIEEVMIND